MTEQFSKPDIRPADPRFSPGPTSKRPGWSLDALADAAVGRSHRSPLCVAKLNDVCERSRAILGIPADYRIGIMPGSDTGAIEAAMWSLLGPRGVDVMAWENFGYDWITDVADELPLEDVRIMRAEYGAVPDLSAYDGSRDLVFTWNGTAAGACVPNGDWIPAGRAGLTLCDATSAAFAMDLPWDKLDAVTWSWQKVMGGEAAHGMLVLSPRAVERIKTHTPPWPVPKLFRLTKGERQFNEGIFKGATINTPSMLAVEDALDGLKWAESIGGLETLKARSQASKKVVDDWVAATGWVDFLIPDAGLRSCTSMCLVVADPWFQSLDEAAQRSAIGKLLALLESEGVAYDPTAYPTAPPGLRLWGGATVDTSDLAALLPWLDWGFAQIKNGLAKAA